MHNEWTCTDAAYRLNTSQTLHAVKFTVTHLQGGWLWVDHIFINTDCCDEGISFGEGVITLSVLKYNANNISPQRQSEGKILTVMMHDFLTDNGGKCREHLSTLLIIATTAYIRERELHWDKWIISVQLFYLVFLTLQAEYILFMRFLNASLSTLRFAIFRKMCWNGRKVSIWREMNVTSEFKGL